MGWLRQSFTRRRRYNAISESLRKRREEKIADLTDHGMTRKEVKQTARREFGNVMLIEQHSREVWQWPTVESIIADTKFALRRLRQSPAFAFTVLLTLASGIGANTAVFSVIDSVLIRPLPYPKPEQLVRSAVALTGVGVALGLGAAVGLMGLMKSVLFGVSPLDPLTYTVVPCVLVLCATLASYLPAHRAATLDPVEALRSE